jgi:hypothetical protein
MKMQECLLWLCFGILLLVIAACGSAQTSTVLTATSIPMETVAAITSTSTPVAPSQTPTAFVIPSATVATVAAVPTLDINQAYNFLQRVIAGNPDCLLPCWGGVKPGVTSNAEAEKLLQSLSVLTYGGSIYHYKDKEFSGPVAGGRNLFFENTKIDFVFGWSSERGENTVELLIINADALNSNSEWVYGSKPYNQLFENYNLHNIISQYGIPSQVWTFAEVYYYGNDQPNPSLPEKLNLLLFYDEGILIRYIMPLKRIDGARGEACPDEAFFNMMLVPPGMSQFYEGMMFSAITGSPDSSPYMSIKKATQMTFDEFYQAFRESNSSCLETPLAIWPTH